MEQFTLEKAAEAEVMRLESLHLNDVLCGRRLFRVSDGSEVSVSQLSGKRVLLLVADVLLFYCNSILWSLKKKYATRRGTEEEFEVIYISLCEYQMYYDDCVAELPWLAHPYDLDFAKTLVTTFFKSYTSHVGRVALIAFGPNGRFLAKEGIYGSDPYENYPKRQAFPFTVRDLKEEIIDDIKHSDQYKYGY